MALWFHVTTGRGNHPGSGWAPGECIWSPSANKRGSVAHYGIMREVRPKDKVVICVNGDIRGAATVGSGYREETAGPPDTGAWGYARSFFRIDLVEYVGLGSIIRLTDLAKRFKEDIRQEMVSRRPKYYLFSWYPDSEFYPGGKLVLGQGRFLARGTPVLVDSVNRCLTERDKVDISLEPGA